MLETFSRHRRRGDPIVADAPSSRFGDRALALKSIAGFWAFYLGTVLLRALLGPEAASAMKLRIMNAAIGVVLTLLIYVALRLFARDSGVRRMVVVAATATIPAALILSVVSLQMVILNEDTAPQSQITTQEGVAIVQHGSNVRIVKENGNELEVNLPPVSEIIDKKIWQLVADGSVTWYFLFAAWCAIYIALTQQQRARLTERRLAEAETAAHAAQVRALRYQVNPHFLFNTLNSLSSLVMSGRADRAEEMLLKLSNFFRSSLSMDPSANVTLGEEIALQRLYLEIERVRFPDRLEVDIDVPDALAETPVPALILQPLVENAIPDGGSARLDKVRLEINARPLDGRRIQVDVINSLVGLAGKNAPAPMAAHEGTGVGLANVCQRLQAHYGSRADCRFGPIPGGYQVSLAFPMNDDEDE
jgi:LytS/YehU family sensor histidine kinase